MINLIVALKAEARPLIRHFDLHNRHTDNRFPVYLGVDMALVVSGPGKAAAAAATAWLQGLTQGDAQSAWLNIGIAGHATDNIGDGRIANRITDGSSNRSWYPPQLHGKGIATSRLLTVDSPENDYPINALYDMEAAGFYPAACQFSTSELVQSFKVVSDNRQHANTRITAKYCEQLIESQLNAIDELAETLASMQKQYGGWHAPHPELDRMEDQWHFTVSQHHQLAKLLKRWTALTPGQDAWSRELEQKNTASEVLHCLEQQLNAYT